MFTLVSSVTSPYGRKVRMVVDLLGVNDQMKLQDANTRDAADPIRQINPLGKIPALIPEGGKAIFDSRVIVDYLESTYGDGSVIPRAVDARFRELTLAALAEGINDALLLVTYEGRYRQPEQASDEWLELQFGKIRRGMTAVIGQLDEYKAPGIAAVTLACALSYADWRKQLDWRSEFPVLATWLDNFADTVPAFQRTLGDRDA